MYAQVILRSGKDSGRKRTMQHQRILLGSGEDCPLRIRDRGVAAHHCALFVSGGFLAVHHLAGHGKTYMGDTAIQGTRRLQPGDMLRIGPLAIEVQFDPAELAKTVPPPGATADQPSVGARSGDEETQRQPSPDGSDNSQAATRIVGVCKSKQWTTCPSPSDAAANALKKLSRRE